MHVYVHAYIIYIYMEEHLKRFVANNLKIELYWEIYPDIADIFEYEMDTD